MRDAFPTMHQETASAIVFFCYSRTSSCDDKCADWESRLESISGWEWVTNDVHAIKTALLNGPVPGGMDVYTDFFYYTGGVYEQSWGNYEGGHAVIIIGWDDGNQCWIVKNSWGTGWGEDGYFRIKYNNCKIGVDAGKLLYTPCVDHDGDGYKDEACGGNDCDDSNSSINPGADEVCGDNVDNNCNGKVDEGCSSCLPKGADCDPSIPCCSGRCHPKKNICQ